MPRPQLAVRLVSSTFFDLSQRAQLEDYADALEVTDSLPPKTGVGSNESSAIADFSRLENSSVKLSDCRPDSAPPPAQSRIPCDRR